MTTKFQDVKASVLILTYNQKHLVEETLSSVFKQKTDFPFEVVIGDDASTDGTADFCQFLGGAFPRLRVLRHPKNLGHVANFHATLAECKGRYVGLLGGDDIWCNNRKLHTQVRFLQDHPDYVLSHTHNNILHHSTNQIMPRRISTRPRDGNCFERLASEGNFITASTAVFDKSRLSADDICKLASFPTEDYPLWLLLSLKGNIHFIKESCVNYRVIDGSLGRPLNQSVNQQIKSINIAREIALHFAQMHPARKRLIQRINNRNDVDILRMLLERKEFSHAKNFLSAIPLDRFLTSLRLVRYLLKFFSLKY